MRRIPAAELLMCLAVAACGGGDSPPSPSAGATASPADADGAEGSDGTARALSAARASRPLAAAIPGGPGAFYISPTGNDGAPCTSAAAPCKTFAAVFARMPAGGELVLLDGTYTSSTTGVMHWDKGAKSAQVPSGTPASPTFVHALNPGQAVVKGQVFVGRSNRKDSYIKLQGLRIEGGVQLYNSSFVTLKETGVHGALDIGTNDHEQGNTDNLVEDVWVWASQERGIAVNYRADRNVWRRVVVRGDGCGTEACAGDGNPNIGLTVYDSHDVSVQNVMVVDRVLKPTDGPYADFAVASHTGGAHPFGRNEWLGTLSIKAPDTGYYMEPDEGTTLPSTIRISNAVAWKPATGGFNIARAGSGIVLENLLAYTRGDDAIRIAPELEGTGTLRNAVALGKGRFGLNSAYVASYVNVHGSFSEGDFNQAVPTNVVAGDPLASGAIRYVTRVEAGSMLSGKGAGGSDLGPTILYRYGVDGSRFGQAGYNQLGTVPLWPWPNEARIKAEMCVYVQRGFCSTGTQLDGVSPVTLTSYVWELAWNRMPTAF